MGNLLQQKKSDPQEQKLLIGLAPMEGVSDFATRLWITQNGAPDFTTTPFLRVTKDYPPKRISANFIPEIRLSKAHGIVSCIPQLMAADEDDFIRIAEHFLKDVPFVDVNCGCPSPTVVGHGAGSRLLEDPQRFSAYLRKLIAALGPGRISVKMRLGYVHEGEFAGLLDVLREMPLARLTIHGRTRPDRYTGHARWSFIGHAARTLSIPVFGSGDINDLAGLNRRAADASGMAGVIVGRGALRDPWIFSRLRGRARAIERDFFRLSLLQYVLLQELQSSFWPQLFEAVADGVFECDDKQFECGSLERLRRQQTELFRRVPGLSENGSADPVSWSIGRTSVARGKMLWNYLRSGLDLPPALTVALLRAPSWLDFVEGVDRISHALAQNDVGLGYRPEWDWVYAGEGAKKHSEPVQPLGD